MKTYIEELAIRGFKSFNRKSDIQLTNQLNCIVGANGSGKSNILDSLCFVLGRLSTKSIRAENYSDLLHKKLGSSVPEGEVSIVFNNDSGIFPIDSKKVRIDRRITESGSTKYYINRRRATRKQVLELLGMAKILPEGHNIIMQGDVANFINLSSIDKRKLVEEVAGIHIYESKKETAMSQLSKVEEKLTEARIVITEKKANLNSLEAEKKVAEKYRSYENEKEGAKATELKLRKKNLVNKKAELISKIRSIRERIDKRQKFILHVEKKIQILKEKIEVIEDRIEKKGGDEQLQLQRGIDDLKSRISSSENLITSSENEIHRINTRIESLKDKLSDIELKIAEKEKEFKEKKKEKDAFSVRITRMNSAASSSKKSHEFLEKEAERLEKKVEELKEEKLSEQNKIQELISKKEVLEFKIKDANNKISAAQKEEEKASSMISSKKRFKTIIQKLNKLTSEDSKLAVEISELRQLVDKKEEALAKARLDANESQELLMRDQAVSKIVSSKLRGIVGTVSELGKVDNCYSKALSTLAGAKMKNIVVESADDAIRALKLLKQERAGFATFLPMDKIREYSISSSVIEKKKLKEVIGLAYELISCNPKYRKIFKHIFRDTLVVEDTDSAKRLGIGKFNMITLDGDVFSTSGAITGGYRRSTGLRFSDASSQKQIDNMILEVSKLKGKLRQKENERRDLEEDIISLRQEKAELEGKISAVSDSGIDIEKTKKERKEFENKILSYEKEISSLKKRISELEEKISKATVEKNSATMKLRNFKFGEKSSEIRELESKLNSKESEIAAIKATVENVLLPEKENISKVVRSLEKEKKEFKEQISESKTRISNLRKELSEKQRIESEFYGQLKKLFDQKKTFQKALEKEEIQLKEHSSSNSEDDVEVNSLSIANAKVEAELEAVNVELGPYQDVAILPHINSISEAKRRYQEMSEKLENLGNVNMKALEIYEKVKNDFDEISWKVDKLSDEKKSIMQVIDEIEKKKLNSFMETFDKLNNNFKSIFERISEKMSAELVLDNPEEPFDGGVNIHVTEKSKEGKPGKRLYLGSLSGGQKTLVALAFIFAVQEFEPAPFYLLDEIDAALDKVNSKKVADLLDEYAKKTQIIIISHNDEIISSSESIYGVWMNKKGESTVNSIKI